MATNLKTLVLMSRMSDYMLNCLKYWVETSEVELHIVRKLVDTKQAPFEFHTTKKGMTIYNREDMSRSDVVKLTKDIQPRLIICFGWSDPAYLRAVAARPPSSIAVMTMDNQWHGSVRQMIGIIYYRALLAKRFNHIWVPGERQSKFARLLGFHKKNVRNGLYVANEANFSPIYQSIEGAPKKVLVFVGRYVDDKGINELWRAFDTYHKTNDSTLELICIGVGPLYQDRLIHPKIKHLGFVQPEELRKKLVGGGIFILPSKFEPWGVVVHEFALSGFPLLLSTAVGAADQFLTSENGYLFDINHPTSLLDALAFADGLNDAQLSNMSKKSRSLGIGLSVKDWCMQAEEFLRGTP